MQKEFAFSMKSYNISVLERFYRHSHVSLLIRFYRNYGSEDPHTTLRPYIGTQIHLFARVYYAVRGVAVGSEPSEYRSAAAGADERCSLISCYRSHFLILSDGSFSFSVPLRSGTHSMSTGASEEKISPTSLTFQPLCPPSSNGSTSC